MGNLSEINQYYPHPKQQTANKMTTYGTYKKGLGKGGRARVVLAKKEGGSVRIGQKVYSFPKQQIIGDDKELKFFDTVVSGYTFDTTGEQVGTSINLIPQGVTDSTRIGRKCVIRKIMMKGIITIPTAMITGDVINLYLVLDKQANGADAAYTDIWTSSSNSNAFNNLANSQRFKILKKLRMAIGADAVLTATTVVTKTYTIECNLPCNIPLEFSSTTGAITELKSNNLAWFAKSFVNDDVIGLNMTTRVRFSG